MIGFLFSSPETASAFANEHADGRVDAVAEGEPARVGRLLIAVTGPGKIKAALATERLLRAYDLDSLLHAGPGTSLDEDLDAGDVVGIASVLEGDRVDLDAPTYPQMPLSVPDGPPAEGTLVSQDHSPEPDAEQGYWERLADVRDETGYAVAYVAAQHGASCHVVKAVLPSDAPLSAPLSPDVRNRLFGALASVVGEENVQ